MRNFGTKDIIIMLDELNNFIDINFDVRNKEIGDRVIVWDGSANIDKDSGVVRYGIDPLFQYEAIIISKNCEVYTEPEFNWLPIVRMDLLLKFDSDEEIFCNSKMVKRTDNYGK